MDAITESCRMSDLAHGQRCRACNTRVREDLVDHKFFGFEASCVRKDAANTSPDSLHVGRSE